MPELPYHLINSFSDSSPTSGSQCAVVLLPASDPRLEDADWLQAIAHNFNFPATSFLRPSRNEGGELEYDIRWFAAGVSSRSSYYGL
jgi:predicted PhzF superfamily epimerase YddE/YHI9